MAWFTVLHRLVGSSKVHKSLLDGSRCQTVGDLLLMDVPDEWENLRINRILGSSIENTPTTCQTVLKSDTPIDVVVGFGLKYIHIWRSPTPLDSTVNMVNDQDDETPSALEVLMNAARSYQHLPPKRPTNQKLSDKERQYNKVLETLECMDVGFTHSQVSTLGVKVVRTISEALWFIDAHHEKLLQRSITIPPPFDSIRDMNNYKANKKKKPELSQEGLKDHIDQLADVMMLPWLASSKLKRLKHVLEDFVKGLQAYNKYLVEQSKRVMERHGSKEPVRSLKDKWVYQVIEASKATLRKEYAELDSHLENVSNYTIVSLFNFEPDDRVDRMHWIEKLALSCPVAIYRHEIGGNLRNLNFIWKVPQNVALRSDTEMIKAVNECRKELPLYTTRAMRREFFDRYTITGIKPAVLRDIFRFLTHDESSAESREMADIDHRVATWLASGNDEDLFYDLRKMNGRPTSPLFEPFWDELGRYLDEVGAVDDRRHKELMYLPFAMSVRDLRNRVLERLPPDTPAPSLSWIRLNFSPQNRYNNTALNYTGRFSVKYAVQQRLARIEHEDSWYCGHMWKMLREFAVMWREYSTMLCVDDKSVIPVGEPGNPISTGVRAHHGAPVVIGGPVLAASDHDFHVCGIVPSVAFDVSIPSEIEKGFYSGEVFVTLKDKIFQPSNATRHACETVSLLRENNSEDGVNLSSPILLVYSDGGPDHRTTYITVKVAAVLVFVALDLDLYCAVRTAPHASWVNPAERIMSTLNIGLQNVALTRHQVDDGVEKTMKSKSTMQAVRNAAAADEDFSIAIRESMRPVMNIIEERFQRLEYKERKINTGEASSDEEMVNFLTDSATVIDPDLTCTSVEQLKGLPQRSKAFKEFMQKHCRERNYSFQVKKCSTDDPCWYCSFHPCRIPAAEFQNLHFLPDSVFDKDAACYKPFSDVYGTETNDDDRPSLRQKKSWSTALDKEHKHILVAAKVRDFLGCYECEKRRVIYSPSKLTRRDETVLRGVKEEGAYMCGNLLFPVGHEYHHKLIVREGLKCSSEIETTYYSGAQSVFDLCCIYCGQLEVARNEEIEALEQEYGIVRPICETCLGNGKRPVTRCAKKGRKRARGYDEDDDADD